MADDDSITARFNLEVESNAAQVARDGADGLANLQEKLASSTEQLRNMNAAFRNLKGGAGVGKQALDELKAQIGQQKAAIAAQQYAYTKLGGSYKSAATQQREKMRADKQAAKLQEQTKPKVPLAAIAAGGIAAAVMLLKSGVDAASDFAKAVADAAYGLGKFAAVSADARRSEGLQLEGLTKIRYGLYGLGAGYGLAADKASFLQSTIDQVAGSTALGRDKVVSYTEQLYRMGLRSGNLQAALEGVTMVAATQGDAAASSFVAMAAGARMAGISVRKLADDAKARLGGIAAAQMLSLTVQSEKLHENFKMLFSGVKLEPMLKALQSVTSLFQLNTIEGLALKQVLTEMFQPLIDAAPMAGLSVRKTLQYMVIAALKAESAILDLQLAFYDLQSLRNVIAVFYGVSDAIWGVASGMSSFASFALLADSAIGGLSSGVDLLDQKLGSLLGRFKDPAHSSGKMIATGLTNGMLGGLPEIVSAATLMGESAIDALQRKLQIHSPSRLTMGIGRYTSQGFAIGVRQEKPSLEREIRNSIARPVLQVAQAIEPAPSRARSSSRAGAASGHSFTFNFGDIHGSATDEDLSNIEKRMRRVIDQYFGEKLVLAAAA